MSLVALGVSLVVQWGQRRREDFELARSLHQDLTSGEVAQARDILGGLVRSDRALDATSSVEATRAYFTLLWCFERIEVGLQISSGRPRQFLTRAIRWHVLEWERDIVVAKRKIEKCRGAGIDDERSQAAPRPSCQRAMTWRPSAAVR
ncbi:hypothetical protein [Micromonospora inyonensis]|uniref:hypothetical protein n=1 Tax=Micromonospora inyonensis TaxID=47866 RepID=UPI00114C9289|nr:hypothetical protein [Micromonospora inyonensis]